MGESRGQCLCFALLNTCRDTDTMYHYDTAVTVPFLLLTMKTIPGKRAVKEYTTIIYARRFSEKIHRIERKRRKLPSRLCTPLNTRIAITANTQRMQDAVQMEGLCRLYRLCANQPSAPSCLPPTPPTFVIPHVCVLHVQESHHLGVSIFSKRAPGRRKHPQIHPRAAESHPGWPTHPRSGRERHTSPSLRL